MALRPLMMLWVAGMGLTWFLPHTVAAQSAFQDRDLLQREAALQVRLVETVDLRRRLIVEDRYARPIYPGVIAMGVGFGLSAASSVLWLLNELSQRGGSEQATRNRRHLTILFVAHGVGIPLGIGGLGFIGYQVYHRPHRAEVQALALEQRELRQELKRIRRDRRLRERERRSWSLAPRVSIQRASLSLELSHTF